MAEPTNSKVPRIRFKGCVVDWDETPIGEILSEKKRPVILKDKERYELITVKRRNAGVVPRGSLLGREILVKNYSQLEAGDFVVSKRQVIHGATGIIPSHLDGAIVSNEYLIAVGNSRISTEFLTLLATLPDMRKKFFLSSYGVDIEKMVFEVEDWKKRGVTIPSVSEQTQIGGYFREVDRLIGLQQRKHDKLVTLKKAMLQKMFPQPGTPTPEIRFKGFEGEWVEIPVSELIFSLDAGVSVNSGDRPANKSELGVLKTSAVTNGVFESDQNKVVLPADERSRLKEPVCGGTIIISRMNTPALVGANAYVESSHENLFLPDRLWAAKPREGASMRFLAVIFGSDEGRASLSKMAKGTSGSMKNITKPDVFASTVKAPTPAEQQKIGHYFRTLDSLISKHAVQLAKLKQLKSACLERMFV